MAVALNGPAGGNWLQLQRNTDLEGQARARRGSRPWAADGDRRGGRQNTPLWHDRTVSKLALLDLNAASLAATEGHESR